MARAQDLARSLPRTDKEIGAVLKQLRGRRSLRDVAKELAVGKTSLGRYETGETPVPLALAAAVDKVYGGDGWVAEAIVMIGRRRWRPWLDETPHRMFAHRWPARYQGLVWIWLRPVAERVGHKHTMTLRWGPWRCDVEASIGEAGLMLVTGKGSDETATVLNLDCNPVCHALFGLGEDVEDVPVIDIRQRWFQAHD